MLHVFVNILGIKCGSGPPLPGQTIKPLAKTGSHCLKFGNLEN